MKNGFFLRLFRFPNTRIGYRFFAGTTIAVTALLLVVGFVEMNWGRNLTLSRFLYLLLVCAGAGLLYSTLFWATITRIGPWLGAKRPGKSKTPQKPTTES